MSTTVNKNSYVLKSLHGIEEQTNSGNWFDRVKRSLDSKKIQMQTMIHPCVIDGYQTLIYERRLQETDPVSYQYIVEFAEANGYRIKVDQRANFIDGIKRVKNKRRANVISVMVLTASLLPQNAIAKSIPHTDVDNISLLSR